MNPAPPQYQLQPVPPAAGPVPPAAEYGSPESGYPAAPYPHNAWRKDDDGPFDWGPWSDSDGEWGVNDWFGDWGSLFDGTGSLEMDFELDMSMDFDAQADADADSDTRFRGDSYYQGYEGYGPYGQYPLYPPAPVMAPPPGPLPPAYQGPFPPAVNQAPVMQ